MNMSGYIAGAAAMALVVLGPNAVAQQGPTPGQPGSTTGPAAGTTVQPSTAVQKESPTAASRGAAGTQGPTGRAVMAISESSTQSTPIRMAK
jgi:hypothetical protein